MAAPLWANHSLKAAQAQLLMADIALPPPSGEEEMCSCEAVKKVSKVRKMSYASNNNIYTLMPVCFF